MHRPVQIEIDASIPTFFERNLKFGIGTQDFYANELSKAFQNLIHGLSAGITQGTINRLYTLKDKTNLRNDPKQLMRCKIGILFAIKENDDRKNKLNEIISELNTTSNKDNELWWYYGALLNLRASFEKEFNNKFFEEILSCIGNIQDDVYKIGLRSFLLGSVSKQNKFEHHKIYSDYINSLLIEELGRQFLEHKDYLSGHFAEKNHVYIRSKELKNHVFYDLEKSESRIPDNGAEIIVPTIIDPQLQANFRKMLVFYAHLSPPEIAGMKFDLPANVPTALQERINQDLTEKFFEKGIYNSERMLATTEHGSSFQTAEVKQILVDILNTQNIQLPNKYDVEALKTQLNQAFKKTKEFQKRLKGFNVINALSLLHECLTKADTSSCFAFANGFIQTDENQKIINALKDCVDISTKTLKCDKSNKTGPQKFQVYIEIARDLLQDISLNKKSRVIQVGTPIRVDYDIILMSYINNSLTLDELKIISDANEKIPILVKRNNNIDIYGNSDGTTWKITSLNPGVFQDMEFPADDQKKILKKDNVKDVIYKEIAAKNGHTHEKRYSTHAMYVTLKCVEENRISKLCIAVTNAGAGVSKHHIPQYSTGERKEYQYVAFKPIELSEQNKNTIIDYVTHILRLEYTVAESGISVETDSSDNVIGESPNSFNGLMQKFYQPKPSDFSGLFIRQDLDKTFFAQVTGNCSVHNLKYALKLLFDMSEARFGYLLDRALVGLNEILQASFNQELANINNAPANHLQPQTQLSSS